MRTHPLTRALTATLAATAAALSFAPAASARAKKPAAPALTIADKTCNIGPEADDRSAVVTALASYGGVGDRVQLRFTVQQRADAKSKWRAVAASDDGDLGTWTTTDGTAVDLRYTKTITGLAEGTQYRVAVDARAVDADGHAATAQRRRYVSCKQPLFTPTLTIASTALTNVTADGSQLSYAIRNAGRLPAGDVTVTLYDGDTRALLSTVTVTPGPEGGKTVKGVTTGPVCPKSVFMTIAPADAPADAAPADSRLIRCAGSTGGRRSAVL